MSTQAFALRADYEDIFVGGTLAYGAGQQTFNVGEELQKNGGVIVVEEDPINPTDSQLLVEALSNYEALKHIPVTEAQKRRSDAAKKAAKRIPKEEAARAVHEGEAYDEATLQALHMDDLWDLLDDSVVLKASSTKDELVQAILNQQKGGDA